MYIGLKLDGTFESFKNEAHLLENSSQFEYLIFDCSSKLKGPLHTIVKKKNLHSFPDSINVKLKVDYQVPELPWNESNEYDMDIDISTSTELFTVASMCHQYEAFNSFMTEMIDYHSDNIGSEMDILIKEIEITYPVDHKNRIDKFRYDYTISCKLLRKFLNDHYMNMCCDNFLKRKYLIFKGSDYYLSSHIPNDYDYIGIGIAKAECFYLLSKKKYERIEKIRSIEVDIGVEEFSTYSGELECHPTLEFMMTDTSNIIESMLFIPQFLLIKITLPFEHFTAYRSSFKHYLKLSIDCKDGLVYNVFATDKEIRDGVSLFKIINAITKI